MIIAYFIRRKDKAQWRRETEERTVNSPILGLVVLRYMLRRWHRVAGGRTGRVAAGDGRRITPWPDGGRIWIAALIRGRSIAMIARRRII